MIGRRSAICAAALLLTVGACDITVSSTSTVWGGRVVSGDASIPLSGTVGAVSSGRTTEATIQIINAAPSTSYRWEILGGTCEQPGDRVGGAAAYPRLDTSESGIADATTVLSESMDAGGTFVAIVTHDDEPRTVIACGELAVR